MSFALSVLDLAPVAVNLSAAQALQNTILLASAADRLGYTRYWLAEHHNIPSIAISAPEILLGIIAYKTERIRVGAGGIMLPNHAPLRVAEIFSTLAALYPGRIDLGIGRAPGTDPSTALALRQSRERLNFNDFPDRLRELMAFGRGTLEGSDFPAEHKFHSVRTIPTGVAFPPIWLLGSSRAFSADLAASYGLGFAFAYHINPTLDDAVAAMESYRSSFVPSADRPEARTILAVNIICSDSADRAEALATVLDLAFVRRQQGQLLPLPTVDEATTYAFSAVEQAQAQQSRARMIIGEPQSVRNRILQLVEATAADEVAVVTTVADFDERLRSYELLAESFELSRAQIPDSLAA